MSRASRLGVVLLLTAAVAGCTAGSTGSGATSAGSFASTTAAFGAPTADDVGTDVGNSRPQVSYDGLMVRRRVVVAIRPTPGADVGSLRRDLDQAAASLRTTLSDVSPTVLDPVDLERLAPDVTLLLPVGATLADAGKLFDPTTSAPSAFPEVEDYEAAEVLVHDLRFTVRATDPNKTAAAIAREGILADALGTYSTSSGNGRLDITYTGPLLSDDLVELVRGGIVRGGGVRSSSSVTISPRSTAGVGVDIAKEPAPAAGVDAVSAPHRHGTALPATLPGPSESSTWSLWAVALVALAACVIFMLVLPRRANGRPGDRAEWSGRTTSMSSDADALDEDAYR